VVLIEINIKKKIYFFVKKKMQIREKKKARRSCQAKVANPFKKGPRAGLQWQAHMHGPLFLRKANVVKTHIF
jgi:hypothetical protein